MKTSLICISDDIQAQIEPPPIPPHQGIIRGTEIIKNHQGQYLEEPLSRRIINLQG